MSRLPAALTCISLAVIAATSGHAAPPYASVDDYPIYPHENLWLQYHPTATTFRLWAPTAEQVRLRFFADGDNAPAQRTIELQPVREGLWETVVRGDQHGVYYTFQVRTATGWLAETPGIYATAVGVNGQRAMVLDPAATNPTGWATDHGPGLAQPNAAVIYEVHVRDFTIAPNAGSAWPGKFLGLAEAGTTGPDSVATGLDHLRELGITHVHLLPAFDHCAIDETDLGRPQYNWGYDPQNYNVPEGSFATDPFDAAVRIREFKQMVQALHDRGIGVILDVVFNHTGRAAESNFNQEVPGYYYRHRPDGTGSDASGCGNETASERPMMRKFMVESVLYWAREYHLDGFRFDLMGIHDIATMNAITSALTTVNPSALVYGEGWTAGDSPLPWTERALKQRTFLMPRVSAFSDDLRDGLKGSVFDLQSTGFVSGAAGTEESVKFGVVGAIPMPGVDLTRVAYADDPWAWEPWQSISYVSCHDNHTLFDKLKLSRPDAGPTTLEAMDRLANAVVLTAQGIPFLHAGVDMLRTKEGAENSFNLPDAINRIDWAWKARHRAVFDYYRRLIALRKAHPAFYLPTGTAVRTHLTFLPTRPGMVGFVLRDHANGDRWRDILVIYNANPVPLEVSLPTAEPWRLAVHGESFLVSDQPSVRGMVKVPGISMLIAFRE